MPANVKHMATVRGNERFTMMAEIRGAPTRRPAGAEQAF